MYHFAEEGCYVMTWDENVLCQLKISSLALLLLLVKFPPINGKKVLFFSSQMFHFLSLQTCSTSSDKPNSKCQSKLFILSVFSNWCVTLSHSDTLLSTTGPLKHHFRFEDTSELKNTRLALCSSAFFSFVEEQSLQNFCDLVKTWSLMYSVFSRCSVQSIIKTMGPIKSAFIHSAVGIMLQWKSDCLIRILSEYPIWNEGPH